MCCVMCVHMCCVCAYVLCVVCIYVLHVCMYYVCMCCVFTRDQHMSRHCIRREVSLAVHTLSFFFFQQSNLKSLSFTTHLRNVLQCFFVMCPIIQLHMRLHSFKVAVLSTRVSRIANTMCRSWSKQTPVPTTS